MCVFAFRGHSDFIDPKNPSVGMAKKMNGFVSPNPQTLDPKPGAWQGRGGSEDGEHGTCEGKWDRDLNIAAVHPGVELSANLSRSATDATSSRWHLDGSWLKKSSIGSWVASGRCMREKDGERKDTQGCVDWTEKRDHGLKNGLFISSTLCTP